MDACAACERDAAVLVRRGAIPESVEPALPALAHTHGWDAAYRQHAGDLVRYLRRLSPNAEVAEELMQETFARAIRASRAPTASHELRPWLYRIATNVAIDRLRRDRRLRFIPFAGREVAPECDVAEIDLVRRALRAIAPEQATALVLRLHEGFSPAEIAQMLDIGETAVKSRLVRGRRAFIAAYEGIGGRL
jgi:RNA polymerase sigma-70 factor (ECF subfamily)